ncbi:MAG: M48 family metallopeptidase [Ruminococcus sp.]|nr:M48 family metallopeptidase [Ruminococcus sp.]
MRVLSSEKRTVQTAKGVIEYTFERKEVKNINLRICHDGSIYVSASVKVSGETVENFIVSRTDYIFKALNSFSHKEPLKTEMQYISGENVTLLGRNMRIKIEKDCHEYVSCDGIYVYIRVKRPDYYSRKRNLLNAWIDSQCMTVFMDMMHQVYKKFEPYSIEFPQLKIRNMTSRWGSCQPAKGIITLNKRLIESSKNCIEYVVTHEFCHLIHPNHSQNFYSLLQVMLPDWKESKNLLEESVIL